MELLRFPLLAGIESRVSALLLPGENRCLFLEEEKKGEGNTYWFVDIVVRKVGSDSQTSFWKDL